jgi:hypothetical protein
MENSQLKLDYIQFRVPRLQSTVGPSIFYSLVGSLDGGSPQIGLAFYFLFLPKSFMRWRRAL